MTSFNQYLKAQLFHLKNLFRLLFPLNKTELNLLIVTICFYFIIGIVIATQSTIMHKYMDAYFSLDNSKIFHSGISNYDGHPLLYMFTALPVHFGNFLYRIFGTMESKAIFIMFICNYLVASSAVYIFRYLKEIIGLEKFPLYSITIFYIFSWTSLTLSFTFETFTFSLFLLSFIVYYYSAKIKYNSKTSPLVNAILAISIGGITLTNFTKGLIPILFIDEKKKTIITRIMLISIVFVIIYSLVIYTHPSLLDSMAFRFNKYTVSESHYFKNAFCSFWGSSFLYPPISAEFTPAFNQITIMPKYLQHIWEYIIISMVGIFVIYSMIYNYRNKYVQMLSLYFLCDITLHLIVKYGIDEAFLYSGHWFYLIPLFLGWFYKSIPVKYKKVYSTVLGSLIVIIVANNLFQQIEFLKLAIETFPSE